MKNCCFGCGAEKDIRYLETYPFPDEDGICDDPIGPLFVLDCQGPQIPNDPNGYCEYRKTLVCHACFHALSPDMWISKEGWESLNPKVPYDKLPMCDQKPPVEHDIFSLKPLS